MWVLSPHEPRAHLRELVLDEERHGWCGGRAGGLVDPRRDVRSERGGVLFGQRRVMEFNRVGECLEAPEANFGVGGGLIPRHALLPSVGRCLCGLGLNQELGGEEETTV